MRKQTKLVAVLSAAALLAMGASMTSFAAGWEKDDAGVWHYYDKDDEMVTGEWRKDGAKWFYLDEDGDMLMDSWVDDEYYVGADGAMLVNQWAKTIAARPCRRKLTRLFLITAYTRNVITLSGT